MHSFKSVAAAAFLAVLGASPLFAGPEIDFSSRPNYISNNTVSLSFDDGPDFQNTARVLDVLKQKNAKATFFINRDNWSNIDNDEGMRNLVRRMVNEGHELGSHTARHQHLSTLSDAQVEEEIASLERSVRSIFGVNAPRLTLLRAPFGDPFQNQNQAYPRVSAIVARHAVHIGWAIDSNDFNCFPGDSNCVYRTVVDQLKKPGQGSYGSVLMHSVHSQTAAALPAIIDYIRANGFVLRSTEDLVRARYGKSSAQLIGGGTTPPVTPPATNPIRVDGIYSLISRHSGKCLDVSEVSVQNGALMHQWDCVNGGNQKFRLASAGNGAYYLVAQHSKKCVDIAGVSTANGAAAHQWDCLSAANQRVTLQASTNGSYVVRFAHSGKCLDVSGPTKNNGQKVHQWECHKGDNQDWFFRE